MFPFARFPGVDTLLGPEMRSTGEVMGLDRSFGVAFAKSQLGARHQGADVAARCSSRCATATRRASCDAMQAAGRTRLQDRRHQRHAALPRRRTASPAAKINKVLEGRPHIVDAIKNGEIQLVFNTTEGKQALSDSRVAAPRGPLA